MILRLLGTIFSWATLIRLIRWLLPSDDHPMLGSDVTIVPEGNRWTLSGGENGSGVARVNKGDTVRWQLRLPDGEKQAFAVLSFDAGLVRHVSGSPLSPEGIVILAISSTAEVAAEVESYVELKVFKPSDWWYYALEYHPNYTVLCMKPGGAVDKLSEVLLKGNVSGFLDYSDLTLALLYDEVKAVASARPPKMIIK